MATVPAYHVHSYEFRDFEVRTYNDADEILANRVLRAPVRGEGRGGSFALGSKELDINALVSWRVACATERLFAEATRS